VKGVVYHGPGRIAVEELARPRIEHPRDAVLRVNRTAICGTDLHPFRGDIPEFAAGTVLGHEFAGTVHEAGPEVPFPPGQRVFASDIVACGRCADCARGRHYHCAAVSLFGYSTVVGASVPGGQAEYVRVPYADVVLAATPDDVSDEQALFAGDVLTTAYAAAGSADITPGDVVAVVGAGPVGLLAAMCASIIGAGTVVVADPAEERRTYAASFGITAVVPEDLPDVLGEATAGRGAHAVLEAVGSDAALACAINAAGPRATVAAVGAHHSTAMPFPTRLAFGRELTVRFVVGDPIRLRTQVLALIRSGRIDPSAVISHRLPLDQAPLAYELFDDRQVFKAVLTA
jgi:2-desacetyl-2-hydroxyethyl bacteriochlorophyllide A dehydrogenase